MVGPAGFEPATAGLENHRAYIFRQCLSVFAAYSAFLLAQSVAFGYDLLHAIGHDFGHDFECYISLCSCGNHLRRAQGHALGKSLSSGQRTGSEGYAATLEAARTEACKRGGGASGFDSLAAVPGAASRWQMFRAGCPYPIFHGPFCRSHFRDLAITASPTGGMHGILRLEGLVTTNEPTIGTVSRAHRGPKPSCRESPYYTRR